MNVIHMECPKSSNNTHSIGLYIYAPMGMLYSIQAHSELWFNAPQAACNLLHLADLACTPLGHGITLWSNCKEVPTIIVCAMLMPWHNLPNDQSHRWPKCSHNVFYRNTHKYKFISNICFTETSFSFTCPFIAWNTYRGKFITQTLKSYIFFETFLCMHAMLFFMLKLCF